MTQENLIKEIKALKEKHNVLFLAHYYQDKEIQECDG